MKLARARWHVVVLAALLGAGTVGARPAAAQQDQVVARQLAYDAARSEYEAALAAWRVVENQWNSAIDAYADARRQGDEQRQQNALQGAFGQAREMDRLERRVTETRAALDRARSALLAALDDRLDRLGDQLGAARTPAERAQLTTVIRDLTNQQTQVEAERELPAVRAELQYYSSIQYDGRDTPVTLGAKAQLLRSKAQNADSSIAQIDRQISRIERQLRSSRNAQALVTGVERFGDAQPPVGAPNRRQAGGDVRARGDSLGVAGPAETLGEQLARWRLLRGQVVEARQQFLQRAETFEDMARRIL